MSLSLEAGNSTHQNRRSTDVASRLASLLMEQSRDAGNVIRIPSLGLKLHKVGMVFPDSPPKSAIEVGLAFTSELKGYKIGHLVPEPTSVDFEDANEVHARIDTQEYPFWVNRYVGVNEEGSALHFHEKGEKIVVTAGELVLRRVNSNGVEINQILSKNDETIIPANQYHATRSRKDWAIFHTTMDHTDYPLAPDPILE